MQSMGIHEHENEASMSRYCI